MKRQATFVLYDPRKGEDYRLASAKLGSVFSSVDEGFYVVDAVNVNWPFSGWHVIWNYITCTSKHCYVCIKQWWPKSPKLSSQLQEHQFKYLEDKHSIIVDMDLDSKAFQALMDIFDNAWQAGDGEILIVGLRSELSAEIAQDFITDFSQSLARAELLGCLFYFAESTQAFFFLRNLPEVDIAPLIAELS